MSLGFEQAGIKVVGAVDMDENHVNTHALNFPSSRALVSDLSTITGKELRTLLELGDQNIDVLFGGPPCQGFSLIGKRRIDDPRNLLLLDFARLVAELRPSYFVAENVAGLLIGESICMVERFSEIIQEAGYEIVTPIAALDAADIGVPQSRQRVFMVGYRKDFPAPTRPHSLDLHGSVWPCSATVWDAIGDLPDLERCDELVHSDIFYGELGEASEYASILRGEKQDPSDLSESRAFVEGLTGLKRTQHSEETRGRFADTLPGKQELVSRFHRLPKYGLSPTLRAGTDSKNGSYTAARPIHPTQPRCITSREAARLHSYPDWFRFHSTKWHGFRQIGNSVPPLLARTVAYTIRHALLCAEEVQHAGQEVGIGSN